MAVVHLDMCPTIFIPVHKAMLEKLKSNWNKHHGKSVPFWGAFSSILRLRINGDENEEFWLRSLKFVTFKAIYGDLRYNLGFDDLMKTTLDAFTNFLGKRLQTRHVIISNPRIVDLMQNNLDVLYVRI